MIHANLIFKKFILKNPMRVLLAVILISTMSVNCKKSKTFMKEAIITGFDSGMCPCCGGLMITFNGGTQPYSGEYFLVENNSAEFNIDNTTSFPVYLSVDFESRPIHCSGKMIKITRFAKR